MHVRASRIPINLKLSNAFLEVDTREKRSSLFDEMVIPRENSGLLSDSDSTLMTSNQRLRGPASVDQNATRSRSRNGDLHTTTRESHTLSYGRSIWESYRSFVYKHHETMDFVDGAIHRLLFWLPHHHNSDEDDISPWREVLYGLLSVNQLAMYCSQQQNGPNENSYGFSVATEEEPKIAATSLRIGLHALHSLMPSILELAGILGQSSSSSSSSSSPMVRRKRQAILRWRFEQIKFVIRMYLMFQYWKQMREEETSRKRIPNKESSFFPQIQPGIMLSGGIYHPMVDSVGISTEELQRILRRRVYCGRRTGLKISTDQQAGESHDLVEGPTSKTMIRQILGEILYSLRPLLWAGAEARIAHRTTPSTSGGTRSRLSSDPLLTPWVSTFAMDVLSLGLLSPESRNGNPISKEEWNRRRMKLLLYLLRSPIWNHTTTPILERTSAVSQRIPFFGRIFDSYLWDWILYWKHPFVSEEG